MLTTFPNRTAVSTSRSFGPNLSHYCAVSRESYQRAIREDYRRRTAGKTAEEKTRNLKEIWDWVDNHSTGMADSASYKSVAARMIGTQNQLTNLVRLNVYLVAPH